MAEFDCLDALKALSDRTRLRIVRVLLESPRSVNEIVEAVGASQYNVSKHLRVLRQAGITEVEPEGTRRLYAVAPTFRRKLAREGNVLDFGCCRFDFDKLPD
jgi:DNA-binding transcriptional ArsR family regulator